MANCLVTQLKSSVNNDSLPKLGTLRIEVIQQGTGNRFRLMLNGETTIKVKSGDDGFFYSASAQSTPITTLTSSTSLDILLPSNKTFALEVFPKYNIVHFQKPRGYQELNNFRINIEQFEGCESLVTLGLYQSEGYGSIDKLVSCSNLEDFSFLYCSEITGNTTTLSGMTQMRILQLTNTAVAGSSRDLSGLTALTNAQLRCPNMTFNDADFAHLTNLTSLRVYSGDYDGIASAMVNTGGRTSGTMQLWIADVKTVTFDSSLPNGYSIS